MIIPVRAGTPSGWLEPPEPEKSKGKMIYVPDDTYKALQSFVIHRKDDIELDIEDFGDLKPVLAWVKGRIYLGL